MEYLHMDSQSNLIDFILKKRQSHVIEEKKTHSK